jgi:hypothetical protein
LSEGDFGSSAGVAHDELHLGEDGQAARVVVFLDEKTPDARLGFSVGRRDRKRAAGGAFSVRTGVRTFFEASGPVYFW